MVGKYQQSGLFLIGFGVPFSLFSYFLLENVTLTSIGIAALIMGATSLLLASEPLPKEAIRSIVQSSFINIEALLEELHVEGKAIYLPHEGKVFAFVPSTNPASLSLEAIYKAPKRVVTEVGGKPGVMVALPGSELVKAAGIGPGVEDAAASLVVEATEVADRVKVVSKGDAVVVEVSKVKVSTETPRTDRCLGPLPITLAAVAIANVLEKPIILESVVDEGDRIAATFRVVGYGEA